PGKNKKLLAGKELVRYAIENALKSDIVDDWVLSTDDPDIIAIGHEYQGLSIINRPDEISGDDASAITYVHHALSILKKPYTHTVIIQVTSPFTQPEDIDKTISALLNNKEAASAVSVQPLDFALHPAKLKTLSKDSVLVPYLEEEKGRMSAQQLPKIFVRNGSVYASTIAAISQGNIVQDPCTAYVMPRERSLDINDPIDFDFAEFMLKKYHS
ncbi:MAG: acylneuraminate cytidylyltransferase family protein, partial [Bacteroidota bacterium]